MRYENLASIKAFVLTTNLFALLLGGLPHVSLAGEVKCAFAPHLLCTDQNQVQWSDTRFGDPSFFAQDKTHLYISRNNSSYRIALETGETLWQQTIDSALRYFYPVLDGQYLYLARTDGIVEKRAAVTGKLIWSQQLAEGWVYPPVILGDKVITGGQDRMVWVMDSTNGNIEQLIELGQEIVAPLIGIDGLFIAGTFDSELNAFRPGQAEAVWKIRLSAPAFGLQHDGKKLIASSMDGSINTIEAISGNLLWHHTLYSNAQYWNLIANQTLYSLNHLGTLKLLDINTGELIANLELEQSFAQAPILQGDHLALFDTHGSVKRIALRTLHKNRDKPSFTQN